MSDSLEDEVREMKRILSDFQCNTMPAITKGLENVHSQLDSQTIELYKVDQHLNKRIDEMLDSLFNEDDGRVYKLEQHYYSYKKKAEDLDAIARRQDIKIKKQFDQIESQMRTEEEKEDIGKGGGHGKADHEVRGGSNR